MSGLIGASRYCALSGVLEVSWPRAMGITTSKSGATGRAAGVRHAPFAVNP